MCLAAIQAGIIGAEGGNIKVEVVTSVQSFAAGDKNGVSSGSWGAYDPAFTVSAPDN